MSPHSDSFAARRRRPQPSARLSQRNGSSHSGWTDAARQQLAVPLDTHRSPAARAGIMKHTYKIVPDARRPMSKPFPEAIWKFLNRPPAPQPEPLSVLPRGLARPVLAAAEEELAASPHVAGTRPGGRRSVRAARTHSVHANELVLLAGPSRPIGGRRAAVASCGAWSCKRRVQRGLRAPGLCAHASALQRRAHAPPFLTAWSAAAPRPSPTVSMEALQNLDHKSVLTGSTCLQFVVVSSPWRL